MASDVERRLGRQVASYRKAAGLTQEAVAERAKVAPETISRLERGSTVPSLKTLERVAEAMGVALKDLFELGTGRTRKAAALDALVRQLSNASPGDVDLVRELAKVIVAFREKGEG